MIGRDLPPVRSINVSFLLNARLTHYSIFALLPPGHAKRSSRASITWVPSERKWNLPRSSRTTPVVHHAANTICRPVSSWTLHPNNVDYSLPPGPIHPQPQRSSNSCANTRMETSGGFHNSFSMLYQLSPDHDTDDEQDRGQPSQTDNRHTYDHRTTDNPRSR